MYPNGKDTKKLMKATLEIHKSYKYMPYTQISSAKVCVK